jgi:hypothetical protein
MIGLGAFWFQSFVGSWKVKMTAVNIDPITLDILSKSCIPPGARGTEAITQEEGMAQIGFGAYHRLCDNRLCVSVVSK